MNGHRHAAGLRLGASTDSLSQASPHWARGKWNVRYATRGAATLLLLGVGAFALAADSENIYLAHTDEELSAIAADWQTLTTEERRDYFIEVRRRMAEAGQKRAEAMQLPRVVGERRFGRVIPQPDGSVLADRGGRTVPGWRHHPDGSGRVRHQTMAPVSSNGSSSLHCHGAGGARGERRSRHGKTQFEGADR